MDSILEEKEEDNDFVRIYLQIHFPKIEDKPYYKIDFDKNILVLFDSINRTSSEKDGIFEMDKIFTNENNNLYIYEEICSNTIKDTLNGESHVFISYGNTISDKLKLLIGDVNDSYSVIEHRGLFPIFLEKLINEINNNINYRENLSINLSYFLIFNDKLIDLSNFIGKNFSEINENNIFNIAIDLEKDENIKKIKKVPTENINDVIFFINKLFLFLMNQEEESEHHLYSRSHFSIIVYIINNNGKIISTLTFILLNGSEIKNIKNNPPKNINIAKEQIHKNNVSISLNAINSQYTYDSIIYALKNNNYINKIQEKDIKDKNANTEIDYTEKNKISNLSRLLYDICFSPKITHIKFRIIGTILPNTGYYDTCKDTLMFLFNCRKAISTTSKNKDNLEVRNSSRSSTNKSKKSRKNSIFDLENKIKFQACTIADLNKNLEKRNEKIFELEQYYKKQVEVLKNYFGFSGNVDVLLTGDENTPDYIEAQKIKDAKDDINYYKKSMKNLEKKMENKENEIAALKNEFAIKLNDRTMVKYYLGVNEMKKKKEKDNKNRNNVLSQIEIFEKELKMKNNIIKKLEKELETKTNIIMSIPKIIKNHMEKKDDENSINSGEIIYVKNKKKEVDKTDLIQMARFNTEEIKILKEKYENILKQKDKEILENNYNINKLENDSKTNINLYKDELNKLYNLFMRFLNYCQQDFLLFFKQKTSMPSLIKKKEEFELYLKNTEKEINVFNFPFIFKVLNKGKNFPNNSKKISKIDEQILLDTKKDLINNNRINMVENNKEIALNFEDLSPPTLAQIKKFIESKNINNNFQYTQKQLEKIPKDRLIKIYNNIIKYIQELENYINKYKEKNNLIDKSQENEKKIENLNEKIIKLSSLLDNEIQKNNKNLIVINSQNKMIERLQKENTMSKNILKYKNDYSSYKVNLSKYKDKYPILIQDQFYTISNKENNFINYKKSSFHVKWRNKTESNNYSSNNQNTGINSGHSSYIKTITPTPTIESNININNYIQNKIKRRPYSSK